MAKEQDAKDPAGRKARQATRDAVRRDHVEKPDRCTRCGQKVGKANLAGHHAGSYRNPPRKRGVAEAAASGRIQWLCHRCHAQANKSHPTQDFR